MKTMTASHFFTFWWQLLFDFTFLCWLVCVYVIYGWFTPKHTFHLLHRSHRVLPPSLSELLPEQHPEIYFGTDLNLFLCLRLVFFPCCVQSMSSFFIAPLDDIIELAWRCRFLMRWGARFAMGQQAAFVGTLRVQVVSFQVCLEFMLKGGCTGKFRLCSIYFITKGYKSGWFIISRRNYRGDWNNGNILQARGGNPDFTVATMTEWIMWLSKHVLMFPYWDRWKFPIFVCFSFLARYFDYLIFSPRI